jgi:hypothetical protein
MSGETPGLLARLAESPRGQRLGEPFGHGGMPPWPMDERLNFY